MELLYKFFISRFKIHQVRYLIIPFLALLLAHLITYQKLPFEPDYQFPLITFLVIAAVGLMVCETNRYNYNRLAHRYPFSKGLYKAALKRLGSSFIITGAVFLVTTAGLNLLISGALPTLTRFLSYLLIVWLIVIAETAIFIAYELYQQYKRPVLLGSWQIPSGNQLLQVKVQDVEYIISKNGLVVVVLGTGQQITTNFKSFNEVKQKLDCRQFFRINRQYLVKASAIVSVTPESNRKLLVTLHPIIPGTPVNTIVSRYKSPEFKRWLKSHQ